MPTNTDLRIRVVVDDSQARAAIKRVQSDVQSVSNSAKQSTSQTGNAFADMARRIQGSLRNVGGADLLAGMQRQLREMQQAAQSSGAAINSSLSGAFRSAQLALANIRRELAELNGTTVAVNVKQQAVGAVGGASVAPEVRTPLPPVIISNNEQQLVDRFNQLSRQHSDRQYHMMRLLQHGATIDPRDTAAVHQHLKAVQALKREVVEALSSLDDVAARSKELMSGGAASTGWFSKLTSGVNLMRVTISAFVAHEAVQFMRSMYDMVESQTAMAESMVNLADRTGLSLGQVDRLSAMSRVAAVNVEALEASAKTMSAALEDTSVNGSKAWTALDKLGVSAYDSAGNQREMGEVLWDTLQALSRVGSDSERTATAVSLLGRGAVELMPLIRNFQELDAKAREAGYGTRDGLIKAMAEANDVLDSLNNKWIILKAQLASKIIGTVEIVYRALNYPREMGERMGGVARTFLPGGVEEPKVNPIATSDTAASQLARDRGADFRRRLESTPEGRLARLKDELNSAHKEALGGKLGAADRYFKIDAEIKALEESLKHKDDSDAKRIAEIRARVMADIHARNQLGNLYGTSYEVRMADGTRSPSADYEWAKSDEARAMQDRVNETAYATEISKLADQLDTLNQRRQEQLDKIAVIGDVDAQTHEAITTKKLIIEQVYWQQRMDLMSAQLEAEQALELAKAGENAELRSAIIQKYAVAGSKLMLDTQAQLDAAQREATRETAQHAFDVWKGTFDRWKQSSGEVFDALVSHTRSWGQVFQAILRTMVLTPLKEAFTTWFARSMTNAGRTPGGWLAGLGGIFGVAGRPQTTGGVVPGVTPGTTPPFLPASVGMINPAWGQAATQGAAGGFGTKSAQAMFSGKWGGLVQGGLLIGGMALGGDGWRRGGWAGAAELAGGGAMIGGAIGGPLGAGIGAAIGFGVGAIKAIFGGGLVKKIQRMVKDMYGVSIDKQFAKSLAEQSKGMDLRVFLASSSAREQIQLYAEMTNQSGKMTVVDDKARGVFFTHSGGSFTQTGNYVGNSLYGYHSSVASAPGLNLYAPQSSTSKSGDIVLDKSGTKEFLTELFVGGIVSNPRAVQQASNSATSQSYGRTAASINLNDPLAGSV